MNRLTITSMAVWLALACVPTNVHAASKEDDVEWARQLVLEFFDRIIFDQHTGNVAGLLNPQFAKEFVQTPTVSVRCNDGKINVIRDIYENPKITSSIAAPNGSEIIFKGTLKGKKVPEGVVEYYGSEFPDCDFVVRVLRDSERGSWSIRYLRLKACAGAAKNPEK